MGETVKRELKAALPRWRATAWLADAGPDVPDDVRRALIRSLYSTLPIFLGGVINTVAVSGLIATRIPTTAFLTWFAMEVGLAIFRLGLLIISYRRSNAGLSTPTDIYLIAAVLWAASVGYGTFISMLSGDWVSAALACLSAAAMVGGICFRNYAAPRLVAIMILLSLGPCAIGAVMSGEWIMLVVMLQIPAYLYSMARAAYQLNRILVATYRAERENAHRASHDTLTGLLNRAGLADAVEERIRASHPAPVPAALFYVDLDGFKSVNDATGHAGGDLLLQHVAGQLREVAGPDDLVARLGGDEFVLISPLVDGSAASARGATIIAAISETPFVVEGQHVSIGVSVGVAFTGKLTPDLSTLMSAADTALYQAKALGRGRCVTASDSAGIQRRGTCGKLRLAAE